jgi:hypothetical protein
MRQRCGIVGIGLYTSAKTIEELRSNAKQLLDACDKPVISNKEYEREPPDPDDDDEDEEDED